MHFITDRFLIWRCDRNYVKSANSIFPSASRRERLHETSTTTTLYDLSSYILKNDLSQLALGICDVMRSCKDDTSDKFPLDKSFTEQGGKTLLHLAVQSNSLATVHCLVMVSELF